MKSALKVWQLKYCEGDFERCIRLQRGRQGRSVPSNLLPNGEMLALAPPSPDHDR